MKHATFVVALLVATLVGGSGVAAQKAKNQTLGNATVKSVTASSLTVTSGDKDMTFAIDAKTNVVGKGLGTKSNAKGGKPTITDLLKEGDRVSVTYQEMGSTMHASRIEKH
jgi:hypothetical protein